ncbi:MAG: molybdopterin-guanine dinucleotide biosynthesis protein B [Candidatus Thiodiazotropha sp.]|jgi:molybdopterin-guanine dinucleotide biosynthesis protein MobB
MIDFPRPLLGFSAFSGTGKTTLLKQLLPILKQQGLRIAVIKHASHDFDIDRPGKDSYELRMAGASPMLIASRRRMALVVEFDRAEEEPTLDQLLPCLDPSNIDLALIEGFKQADIMKIELHRPSLGKPLLCTNDPRIIAVATDAEIPAAPMNLPRLDINDPMAIARFILQQVITI